MLLFGICGLMAFFGAAGGAFLATRLIRSFAAAFSFFLCFAGFFAIVFAAAMEFIVGCIAGGEILCIVSGSGNGLLYLFAVEWILHCMLQ